MFIRREIPDTSIPRTYTGDRSVRGSFRRGLAIHRYVTEIPAAAYVKPLILSLLLAGSETGHDLFAW